MVDGSRKTRAKGSRSSRSPEFDAVLFDLFGTLIPTGPQPARVQNLKEMARILKVDPDGFAKSWMESFDPRARGEFGPLERTIERLAALHGGHPRRAEVLRAARVRLGFAGQVLASSGRVLSALDALRAAGVRLALVSDTSDETTRLWPETDLSQRFEVTVFSCEEGVRKPNPRIYETALRRLALPASRCAFVGDGGSNELTGARAVGLTPFLYRFPDEEASSAYRVDAEVRWTGPELSDLTELLPPPAGRAAPRVNR